MRRAMRHTVPAAALAAAALATMPEPHAEANGGPVCATVAWPAPTAATPTAPGPASTAAPTATDVPAYSDPPLSHDEPVRTDPPPNHDRPASTDVPAHPDPPASTDMPAHPHPPASTDMPAYNAPPPSTDVPASIDPPVAPVARARLAHAATAPRTAALRASARAGPCRPVVIGSVPQPPFVDRRPAAGAEQDSTQPAPPPAPGPAPPAAPLAPAGTPPAWLVPVYQAAALRYGVPWTVLAAVNAIETDFGRVVAASPAGAIGWMQFLPTTWAAYGLDADGDGVRDPGNPVDAIFAAARYLAASGAATDLRGALFAYNHAGWYVTDVLARAQAIARRPGPLSDALSVVADGPFPVGGPARWLAGPRGARHGDALLYARGGASVRAVADGRILAVGRSTNIGRYVVLEDARGTRFTYAGLGGLAPQRPVRRGHIKLRLFAHPARTARWSPSGFEQLLDSGTTLRGYVTYEGGARDGRGARMVQPARLHRGARVRAGTVLGWVGRLRRDAPAHVRFAVRPAGVRASRIDARLLLDGWRRVLRSSPRAPGSILGPFLDPTVLGSALWPMGTSAATVLADPRIVIYPCGRDDIAAGLIDPRVLATLTFLADSGLDPTASSLRCGHSLHTARGTISEHSTGSAVDIAAINGVPILGHQGPGSITELAIRKLLELQGPMRPHQIISLMAFPAAGNTLALADHYDHIHVGFRPNAAAPSPMPWSA
jgi:hypothetical protein